MLKDIRYAYRTLCQKPGFALTAIVSIALAIGANSSIFSFQDALLLRPLAVAKPSTLVTVMSRNSTGGYGGFPYPDFVDLRDKNSSFDGLIAYRLIPAGVARDEKAQPQFKAGLVVSGNFFDLLGVKPQLGRGFRPDEDQVPGRNPVVVLSHDYWQNELGADPMIVGRHIRLGHAGGSDFTVIGVAPESFTGMDLYIRPAFYIPIMMGPNALGAGDESLRDRRTKAREDSYYIKARLRRGVSVQAANADIAALAVALEQTYPDTNRGRRTTVRTEMQARLDVAPILGGIVAAVFGLMIVILLIACANVMNLMLSRGRGRAREIAIRLSLGSGRARLVRQLMAESLMIAVAGGALGLLLAQGAVEFFSSWELPGDAPIKLAFQLDTRVLAFTLVVSVISALLFGLAPALRSTKTDLNTALKGGGSLDSRKRLWGRNLLVTVQIAGSIVLVMTAAQMYRNTMRVLRANPGFTLDRRLTVRLDSEVAGYTLPQSEQFYRTLVEKARELPGIQSAALSSSLPFTTDALVLSVAPEGFELPQGQNGVMVRGDVVDENYFETFGVPILAGRGFLSSDQANSPKVAVVNQALAQRAFGGQAIGKRFRMVGEAEDWVEVVGVSVTGKYQSVSEPPQPSIYLPYRQRLQPRMTLIASTAGEPAAAAPAVRELIRSINPAVPILSVRAMDDLFQRTAAAQIGVFNGVFSSTGLMGFFLALVGLYAVAAYQVETRTREIGIRMALGAERFQVMKMILKQAGLVAGIGIFIGLALSVAVRPALLAGLGRPDTTTGGPLAGFDPFLFGFIPLCLMLITLFAAAVPARRASRIDPQAALRQE